MGATIKNKSTATEPPPKSGQQPKPMGAKMHLTYQSFAPDSIVVKAQTCKSSTEAS